MAARACDLHAGRIGIENRYDFTDLSGVEMAWRLERNGEVIESGTEELGAIEPHTAREVRLPFAPPDAGRVFLLMEFRLTGPSAWAEKGFSLGFDQYELPASARDSRPRTKGSLPRIEVRETDSRIAVAGKGFAYDFDRRRGSFRSLSVDGHELLTDLPAISLWRAPTDNDRYVAVEWRKEGLDRLHTHTYEARLLFRDDHSARIAWSFSLGGHTNKPALRADAVWAVYGNGEIRFSVRARLRDGLPFLPRFGLGVAMAAGHERVEYFGYGPHESYVDKRWSTWKGRFSATVDELHEDYLMPQENGSHYSTEWAAVTDAEGRGLLFCAADPFSFNASHFTPEDLTAAAHPYELRRRPETIVHLDAMMSGLGSNSCGPELLPQYRLDRGELSLDVRLLPIAGREFDPFEAVVSAIDDPDWEPPTVKD